MRVTVAIAGSIGVTGLAELKDALGPGELVFADPDLTPPRPPNALWLIAPASDRDECAPDQVLHRWLAGSDPAFPIVVWTFRRPGEVFDLAGIVGYADQARSVGRDLEVDVTEPPGKPVDVTETPGEPVPKGKRKRVPNPRTPADLFSRRRKRGEALDGRPG